MPTLPTLRTGAVAQYPLQTRYSFRADIVPFLDGSEQRFRNSPGVLHRWTISLSGLDEQELTNFSQFFVSNQGSAAVFSFTDPSTGVVYPNCSLDQDEMDETFLEAITAGTTLIIRENRT